MDFVCKGTKKCLHMQYLKEKNVFFDGPYGGIASLCSVIPYKEKSRLSTTPDWYCFATAS